MNQNIIDAEWRPVEENPNKISDPRAYEEKCRRAWRDADRLRTCYIQRLLAGSLAFLFWALALAFLVG